MLKFNKKNFYKKHKKNMQENHDNFKNLKITTWAFKEAQKLLKRLNFVPPEKGYVLFETGYGPSGLPHLGTFAEVARTCAVMKAFKILAPEIPIKLFVFSDDLDGIRKVPSNIPNQEMVSNYIGFPLSKIPDPYEEFDSYAEYMNNKLQEFLNEFGFEFEFKSASKCYFGGEFNEILKKTLDNIEAILDVMLPSLGDERRKTYNPFLPISKKTGRFCFDGVKSWNKEKATITFMNDLDEEEEISIYDGNCKLQWKVDWAGRWAGLEVDYEMHGKDLTPTSVLSSRICKILGKIPPQIYVYEFFTDECNQKISKSKGNGVSIEQWLHYGTKESLALFIFENPGSAKKLFLRLIPKFIDDHILLSKKFEEALQASNLEMQMNNPIFYMPFKSRKISLDFRLDFSLIMNVVSICCSDSKKNSDLIFGYLQKYQKNLNEDERDLVFELIDKAFNFYNDFILPEKKYLELDLNGRCKLQKLHDDLIQFFQENEIEETGDEKIQNHFYEIARSLGYEKSNMKEWFLFLYESLFGEKKGPRFGSFIKILGVKKFLEIIAQKLECPMV
jgi:lysyl-tRNA synthetase class 1